MTPSTLHINDNANEDDENDDGHQNMHEQNAAFVTNHSGSTKVVPTNDGDASKPS